MLKQPEAVACLDTVYSWKARYTRCRDSSATRLFPFPSSEVTLLSCKESLSFAWRTPRHVEEFLGRRPTRKTASVLPERLKKRDRRIVDWRPGILCNEGGKNFPKRHWDRAYAGPVRGLRHPYDCNRIVSSLILGAYSGTFFRRGPGEFYSYPKRRRSALPNRLGRCQARSVFTSLRNYYHREGKNHRLAFDCKHF